MKQHSSDCLTYCEWSNHVFLCTCVCVHLTNESCLFGELWSDKMFLAFPDCGLRSDTSFHSPHPHASGIAAIHCFWWKSWRGWRQPIIVEVVSSICWIRRLTGSQKPWVAASHCWMLLLHWPGRPHCGSTVEGHCQDLCLRVLVVLFTWILLCSVPPLSCSRCFSVPCNLSEHLLWPLDLAK